MGHIRVIPEEGKKGGASPKMRNKIIAAAILVATVVLPQTAIAEPVYSVARGENDEKIVANIKKNIETYALPTKEEKAEEQIQKNIERLATEKKKAEAEVTVKKSVVYSSNNVDNSNACVVAMKKIFPEHLWKVGYAIMMAESGARPNAIGGPNYNGTYDYGCWQINNTPRALNPDEGAKIAWYKYNHSGWYPWVAWKSGRYLKFM